LIDAHRKGKISKDDVIAKIPLLLLTVFFIWLSVGVADASRSFPATHLFSGWEKFILSGEALALYMAKLLTPGFLSCLYPFSGQLSPSMTAVVFVFMLSLLGWMLMARQSSTMAAVRGPAIFFLVTIAPVLHLLKVNTSPIY